ncbi:arylalkylamine N-acetyltransferase 1 isoform X2 [Diabrotica virgifera virgifera]|uniref:aralkylamine N-acetyltransferase n=1 Tax=Diabrotica virgifera virgifera TaxID=50390 RepID=A0A6P7FPJ2_DIAVI|nr:arylalkylamine N-acetyltransferase 1 isoform X1 [Diabrotica virgifera virgifera]XP_050514484.1 arylalkylamine N-acetyltransferase 1 isoform X2 [Diabrotica virgifera virgifera]
MVDKEDIKIRRARADEENAVRDRLRASFYKQEPTCASLGVVTEERPICPDLESYTLQYFNKGLNLIAEYNGRIVGVCLTALLEKDKYEFEEYPVTDKKFEKILRMLEYAERKGDLFNRFPEVNKILSIVVLSVDASLRGKGIAKKLTNESKQLAKEHGAQMMFLECSSFFSAAVAKSLGYELIWSMDYENYKVNGEVVLKPAHPHKAVQLFVYKL